MDFIKNEKGCVKFNDTSGITWSMWNKLLARINYLNYGIPDVDDLKKYFDRGVFLQPDQSMEVLKVFGELHETEEWSEDKIKSDNTIAKEAFGTTEDINLAGYILTDGTMLDFSYDHWMRDRDHREIAGPLNINTEDSASAGLIQFVNYGNIRVLYHGLEMSKRPNQKQYSAIARFVRTSPKGYYIDISNNEGDVVKEFYYDFAMFGHVMNDINSYFDSIAI